MKKLCWTSAVLLILGWSTGLPAQTAEDLARPPPIPEESEDYQPLMPDESGDVPIPPKIQGEQIEPTVTIREEEQRTIEEYSFKGQVYMVKITPKGGVPYYYIDTDGDGIVDGCDNCVTCCCIVCACVNCVLTALVQNTETAVAGEGDVCCCNRSCGDQSCCCEENFFHEFSLGLNS